MPFITPINTHTATTAFERFNLLVENYKCVIDNNATARCMIGFTAASLIRNEGDVDIDSVEMWLKSIEMNQNTDFIQQQQTTLEEDQHNTSNNTLDTILNVVKKTAATYCNNVDYKEDDYSAEDLCTDSENDEDDDSFEFLAEDERSYELSRFIRHDVYSSSAGSESYPTNSYYPLYNIVTYDSSDDRSPFSLQDPISTLPC
jgi:hypothetical protein